MTWRGALRSLEVSARRVERDSRRRQNELQRQRSQLNRMLEKQHAAYEVAISHNHIERLRSVHKECGAVWDWKGIRDSPPPPQPTKMSNHEMAARAASMCFHPNIIQKLFRQVDKKRLSLARDVDTAIQTDEKTYQEALTLYERQHSEWQERRDLADLILSGDLQACLEVINEVSPLREISELGSKLEFRLQDRFCIEVTLHVNGEEVVPSEVKSQLQSGKISVKKMPQGQFYELYQDYVCGCALRVARELFALLPFTLAVVTATANMLNSQTGHLEQQPILSVAIQRKTLENLNLSLIDPSDSLKNFVHEMDFKKTRGFKPVKQLDISTLIASHRATPDLPWPR
jgi:hypothetical protein